MKAAGRLLLGLAAVLAPAVLEAQGIPLGSEFQANTYTTGRQGHPDIASAGDGSFVVVWARGPGNPGIFARMYDPHGAPKGSEFQVNSGTAVPGQYPSVAADASGGFVVAWQEADYGRKSHAQRFDSSGAPVGSEIALARILPRVASDAAGNFVLISSQYTSFNYAPFVVSDLVGQRFDGTGAPAGSEFMVASYKSYFDFESIITDSPGDRAVAAAPGGDFTVVWNVWEGTFPQGARPVSIDDQGLFGQRFSKTGVKLGTAFRIALGTAAPGNPAIAVDRLGNFVVIWSSDAQDGDGRGIRGQRFDRSGEEVGPEFQVNTYTTGDQTAPSVAIDETGDFVVVWNSAGQDGSSSGVFGARFNRHGTPLGGEFPVNVYTAGNQQAPRVASDGRGFVAAWESADEDGNGFGVFGRRQNLQPEALTVDLSAKTGTSSDRNGVLEPGETVLIQPKWANTTAGPILVTGAAPAPLCAPGSACITPVDGAATYGTIAAGASAVCNDGSPDACYQVSASGPRPGTHWDGQLAENLSGGGEQPWSLHVGDSFADVPRSQPFYKKIETLLHNGITTGCTATTYCPGSTVARDAMAIFVAKGIAGGGELVPVAGAVGASAYNCSGGGVSLFTDVAPTDAFCKHVHFLAAQNVTLGCNGTQYCPGQVITRDAMASFIAKAIVAPAGGAGVPVSGSGPSGTYSCDPGSAHVHFSDVPATNPFCKHIHFLWANGIVEGCTPTTYCPTQPVARDAMAKFIANGFGLKLYGP